MASLKVWHFIPSPFNLSDDGSLFTLSYEDYLNAVGYAEWTGWSLPDISIMEHAPTEYMAYMLIRHRPTNTANWQPSPQIIRYNTKTFGRNINTFIPYTLDQSTYSAIHLEGLWGVVIDRANNRWKILVSVLAYTPSGSIQSPQNSDLVMVESMSIRGINIYY